MRATLERLDVALQTRYPNLSRSLIQKLIKHGYVTVDDTITTKSGTLLKGNERLELKTDILSKEAEDINLDVMYEDENCVVVNKPAGILTHSKGAYNPEPTVASWLKDRDYFQFGRDEDRAGIVHRLDRATSGVIIAAKNARTLSYLQKQFQKRTVKKTYVAKVIGTPKPDHAILELPIERNPKRPQSFRVGPNGKDAETEYEIVKSGHRNSLVRLRPKTGRTHQLRVHLQYIKHPIIGDQLYGGPPSDRLYLHAEELEITLPNGIRKKFRAPFPDAFYKGV